MTIKLVGKKVVRSSAADDVVACLSIGGGVLCETKNVS